MSVIGLFCEWRGCITSIYGRLLHFYYKIFGIVCELDFLFNYDMKFLMGEIMPLEFSAGGTHIGFLSYEEKTRCGT